MVCVAGLEIRVAERGDAAQTAQMLARAFYDDPVFGLVLSSGRPAASATATFP
jgi:hypothetical protein